MSYPIAAVSAIDSVAAEMAPTAVDQTAATAGTNASNRFEQWITSVDHDQVAADSAVRTLAVGDAGSLHETMMTLESARLSLGLLVQVRNRVVEAYQDLMRMQI